MAKFITASVGEGGANVPEDVRVIQELLNRVPAASGGPSPALVEDSQVGPLTIGAIRKFQKQQFGWQDGRVDPNNKTITRLNTFDTTPATVGPVTFREITPEDGFDGAAVPPWLMVPVTTGSRNEFKLLLVVNGQNVSLVSENRQIATVDRRGLFPGTIRVVSGRRAGRTFINALDNAGNRVARLEVSVKARRRVRASFHFVLNGHGIQTTRPLTDVTEWLAWMNLIYTPQTNIEFVRGQVRQVRVRQNLGPVVNSTGAEFNTIVRNGDPSARCNFFLVRAEDDHDADDGVDNEDAIAEIGGRNCICEDDAGDEIGESLAHEAGHMLGVRHGASTQPMLMFPTTDIRGGFIPKAHANVMNPSGAV